MPQNPDDRTANLRVFTFRLARISATSCIESFGIEKGCEKYPTAGMLPTCRQFSKKETEEKLITTGLSHY